MAKTRPRFEPGDTVRICRVPPWISLLPGNHAAAFGYCVGRAMRVECVQQGIGVELRPDAQMKRLFPTFRGNIAIEPKYLRPAKTSQLGVEMASSLRGRVSRGVFRRGDLAILTVPPPWLGELPGHSAAVVGFCIGKPFPVLELYANGDVVLDVSRKVDKLFGGFKNDLRVEPQYLRRLHNRVGTKGAAAKR